MPSGSVPAGPSDHSQHKVVPMQSKTLATMIQRGRIYYHYQHLLPRWETALLTSCLAHKKTAHNDKSPEPCTDNKRDKIQWHEATNEQRNIERKEGMTLTNE
jgi:hypothetical protein